MNYFDKFINLKYYLISFKTSEFSSLSKSFRLLIISLFKIFVSLNLFTKFSYRIGFPFDFWGKKN